MSPERQLGLVSGTALVVASMIGTGIFTTSGFTYIGFTLGLSTAATVLGLIGLRVREGIRLPVLGWPWVPGLFLVGVLGITILSIARRPVESLFGLATMSIGWLVWRFSRPKDLSRNSFAPHAALIPAAVK